MPKKDSLRVLIAPLDWGLGHTTRCIPIVKYLLDNNCTVILATEGASKELLKIEFPGLLFLSLKGYQINYSKSKRLLPLKILCQLPKILTRVVKERKWLQKIAAEYSLDAIISDNRYGLWHPTIPSIFITHQLQIKGPTKWIETLLLKVNYHFINKFKVCWVPDFEGTVNLAGDLSHPSALPSVPIKYLGTLSRFETRIAPVQYDLLIILSGPEPQRTLLENKILIDLKQFKGSAFLVRGLPGAPGKLIPFGELRIENHLNTVELEQACSESKLIVSRAGYTTLMDLVKLKKKGILIPTPGQTEQEYLANLLQQQSIFVAFNQDKFNLEQALETARTFNYQFPSFNTNAYEEVIDDFLKSLRS